MAQMWMCPSCETLAPMSQARCGGCGREQSNDVGDVSMRGIADLTADAAIFKRARGTTPKKRRR